MHKMVDRLGAIIHKGDCVKYWHKISGQSIPEIGEVVEIVKFSHPKFNEVKIERKHYNNTDFSYRKASGITKVSKAEAVLWKMEQFAAEC